MRKGGYHPCCFPSSSCHVVLYWSLGYGFTVQDMWARLPRGEEPLGTSNPFSWYMVACWLQCAHRSVVAGQLLCISTSCRPGAGHIAQPKCGHTMEAAAPNQLVNGIGNWRDQFGCLDHSELIGMGANTNIHSLTRVWIWMFNSTTNMDACKCSQIRIQND